MKDHNITDPEQPDTKSIIITARTARHAQITAIITSPEPGEMGDLIKITNIETFPESGGPGSGLTFTSRYTVKAAGYERCLRELEAAGFTPDP